MNDKNLNYRLNQTDTSSFGTLLQLSYRAIIPLGFMPTVK